MDVPFWEDSVAIAVRNVCMFLFCVVDSDVLYFSLRAPWCYSFILLDRWFPAVAVRSA